MAVPAVTARCVYPGDYPGAVATTNTRKASYGATELLLYQCDGTNNGFIRRFCQSDNTWSSPEGDCTGKKNTIKKLVPLRYILFFITVVRRVWEFGGLAGIIVAAINYLVAIVFIVHSHTVSKKNEKKKEENRKDNASSKCAL